MKIKLIHIAAITFILILAFGVVMFLLIKKNSECVDSPFTYGANMVRTAEGEPTQMLCSCQIGVNYFYFDRFGIYEKNPLLENYNITERGLIP